MNQSQKDDYRSTFALAAAMFLLCFLFSSCGSTGTETEQNTTSITTSIGLTQTPEHTLKAQVVVTPVTSPIQPSQTPVTTPTLSGPELDATKIALLIEDRREWEAQATNVANGTPIVITPAPITTAPPVQPPPLGISDWCIDANKYYAYSSCWAGLSDNEYVFVIAGALKSDPLQGMVQVYTSTMNLRTRGPKQLYTTLAQAGLVMIVDAVGQQLTLQAENGMLFYFNVSTRQWVPPGTPAPGPSPVPSLAPSPVP